MQLKLKALALSTCCLILTAASCEKRAVKSLPIPPEHLVCEAAGSRPNIPPELVVDWSQIKTVAEAKTVHDGYVKAIRQREGVIAGYIVQTEGRLFLCSSNMQWIRERQEALAR